MSASKETIQLSLTRGPSILDVYQWKDSTSDSADFVTEIEAMQRIAKLDCETLSFSTLSENLDEMFGESDTEAAIAHAIKPYALVLRGLRENNKVTRLWHQDRYMFDENEEIESDFINLIQFNTTITHINLWGIILTDNIMGALAQRLTSHYPLISLMLRSDLLKTGAFPEYQIDVDNFGSALATNKTLKALDLTGYNLAPKTVISIAKALEINQSLDTLSIFGENVGGRFDPEGAKAFGEMLAKNSTLTTLGLGDSHYSSDMSTGEPESGRCFTMIAQGLMQNKSIKNLSLVSDPYIYDNGWRQHDTLVFDAMVEGVIQLMQKNNIIKSLRWCVRLEDKHIPAIAQALAQNSSLRYIDFGFETDYLWLKALSEIINLPSCQLESHGLLDANITDQGIIYLANALKTNTKLKSLAINKNSKITDKGFAVLADALLARARLSKDPIHFNFEDIGITDLSIKPLVELLRQNIISDELTLSSYARGIATIGKATLLAISNALKENTSLTKLDCSCKHMTFSENDKDIIDVYFAFLNMLDVNRRIQDLTLTLPPLSTIIPPQMFSAITIPYQPYFLASYIINTHLLPKIKEKLAFNRSLTKRIESIAEACIKVHNIAFPKTKLVQKLPESKSEKEAAASAETDKTNQLQAVFDFVAGQKAYLIGVNYPQKVLNTTLHEFYLKYATLDCTPMTFKDRIELLKQILLSWRDEPHKQKEVLAVLAQVYMGTRATLKESQFSSPEHCEQAKKELLVICFTCCCHAKQKEDIIKLSNLVVNLLIMPKHNFDNISEMENIFNKMSKQSQLDVIKEFEYLRKAYYEQCKSLELNPLQLDTLENLYTIFPEEQELGAFLSLLPSSSSSSSSSYSSLSLGLQSILLSKAKKPDAGDSKRDYEGDIIMGLDAGPIATSIKSQPQATVAFILKEEDGSSSSAAISATDAVDSAGSADKSDSADMVLQFSASNGTKRKAPSDNSDGKNDMENPSKPKKAKIS